MNTPKIKIVHVVEGFIGGLATYMFHVLPGLHRERFEVTLICSLGRKERAMAEKFSMLRKAGIIIHFVPMKRGFTPVADLYCLMSLWRIFKKHRYDIIHTHCSKAGLLGRLAAVLSGIPVRLHSSHCFAYLRCGNSLLKHLYYWVERLLGMITVKYIAVSPSELENAVSSSLFPQEKCLLAENGIPVQNPSHSAVQKRVLRSEFGISEKTPIITTGCRFVNYKGLSLLLKALTHVSSDCHVIIAGQGRLARQLHRKIVQYRLEEKVSVMTPNIAIDRLLGVSDMAILCSSREAQPYFLLEAMMAGCPVIATDVPGNRELLMNQRGLLVPPDTKEIAKGIDIMLADQSLRESFAESAYRYVSSRHRLERQVERLAEVYRTHLKQSTLHGAKPTTDVTAALNKKAV